jgi:hypothetical protein
VSLNISPTVSHDYNILSSTILKASNCSRATDGRRPPQNCGWVRV